MSAENAVQQYIRENGQRFVEELSELLRIPSISAESAHAPDMLRCAEWLCDALLRSGADRAEVMSTDGNPVVYAEKTADRQPRPYSYTVTTMSCPSILPVNGRTAVRSGHPGRAYLGPWSERR